MDEKLYQRNPVVTFNHNNQQPPVGRSLWRKQARDDALVGSKAKTHYPPRPKHCPADKAWEADEVLALNLAGLLQGKSIGFLPAKVRTATPEETKALGWSASARVIEEWHLLAYAVCPMPVNPHTLVEAVSKSNLTVPPWLLKALGFDRMPEPPTPALPAVIPQTPLAEVAKAVAERAGKQRLEGMLKQAAREAAERARGRV
jgi:hypothetical protein